MVAQRAQFKFKTSILSLPNLIGLMIRWDYDQMRPKLNVLVYTPSTWLATKLNWCFGVLLPVVQGHHLRLMAQWSQQSTRKSWQNIWLPPLGSWDLFVGRLSRRRKTPSIHQNPPRNGSVKTTTMKKMRSELWTKERGNHKNHSKCVR